MTPELRLLVPADAPVLAGLHATGFERVWLEADFVRWLSNEDVFGVLGLADCEPIAFALARATGEDLELLTIATSPGRRGQGWGRAVLQALIAEAEGRADRMVLEVSVANSPALKLYSGAGFVEIGRRKGYYQDQGRTVDALVMARLLRVD